VIVAGITGWLESLVTNLVCFIITALVRALNLILVALGALLEAVAALMPDMPALPSTPAEVTAVMGWVNWFFPVGTTVAVLTFLLTAWLLWQGVAIGLRWAKATSS